MSLGSGIFWSTVLILSFLTVYLITRHRKWKIVGIGFLAIAGLGALGAGGMWLYQQYFDRPSAISSLLSVSLGDRPVDVKLTLGQPVDESDPSVSEESGNYTARWVYKYADEGRMVFIDFAGEKADELGVRRVCDLQEYKSKVLGFGTNDSEQAILDKLGSPPHTSINKDASEKMISYPKWNVAFRIVRGRLHGNCLIDGSDENAVLTYRDEYGETQEESESTESKDDQDQSEG